MDFLQSHIIYISGLSLFTFGLYIWASYYYFLKGSDPEPKKPKHLTVSIEGNIGSGKSTLLKKLRKHLRVDGRKVVFVKEPVDEWEMYVDPEDNKNIMQKYYDNQPRWGLTFQLFAFITRFMDLKRVREENSEENALIITERCIDTDREVFARTLYAHEIISELEWDIYTYYYNVYAEPSDGAAKVDAIIYVNTSVDMCKHRIAKRNRSSESELCKDDDTYISILKDAHDSWFENRLNGKKILYIDGDQEFETNPAALSDVLDKIKTFVAEIP
uniref:Deoxynucleoside kinase domain-containing protein n=1 Tax=viral metagenome TaxID=1070528 RepID=A0A6C0CM22_9ZZZZ